MWILESLNPPAELFQLALALHERIGIARIDKPLFLGEAVEFVEQFQNFRPGIV